MDSMEPKSEDVELEVVVHVDLEDLKDVKEENLQEIHNADSIVEDGETKVEKEEDRLSSRRLRFLICFIGVQAIGLSVIYSIQVIFSAPFFESCGFSRSVTSLFWLLGPLMTLVGSPIVGCLSDSIFIPYLGRRRPFLILSGLTICISLSLFSNSKVFGSFFFDSSSSNSLIVTQVVAGSSFLLLDFSVRVFDISGRSLVADLIPQSQQLDANVWIQGLFVGFGSIYGFGLGAIPWKKLVPYTSENIQVLYFLCLTQLIICVGITCIFVREKRHLKEKNEKEEQEEELLEKEKLEHVELEEEEGGGEGESFEIEVTTTNIQEINVDNVNSINLSLESPDGNKSNMEKNNEATDNEILVKESGETSSSNYSSNSLKNFKRKFRILGILCRLPCSFWMVYAVQFISYLTASVVYIYISLFMCIVVMGGDPNAPNGSKEKEKFEEGLMWGNIGGIMLAISCISSGLLMTCISEIISVKLMWLIMQLCLFGSIFLGCIGKFSIYFEMIPFILFGIAQTGMNTIPFAVVNVISRDSTNLREDKALVQAIFSTAISFPCILISLTGGPSLRLLKLMGFPDLLGLLFIYSLISLTTVVFVLLIKIPESMNEKKKIGVFCCLCDSVRMTARLFSCLGNCIVFAKN